MSLSRGSTARFGSSYYSASGRPRNAPRSGGLGPRGGTSRQARRTGGWVSPTSTGELKFTDVSGALLPGVSDAFTTPGPSFLLNGLVPDSTATGRIGRKIVMKSILIRYTAYLRPTSVGGGPVRILVVYDKQANTNAPAVTDILLADSYTSPNNLSNRDRFITLFDEITAPLSVAGDFAVSGTLYKKNLNLEVMFNTGTAGTIGDITTGSIYILAANTGLVTTDGSRVGFRSRIRYSDP